ncbi:MAG: phospholipase D family protein [Paludibacterium sp.]|uniref:phospholipase D family nuclease n=1 Tax=Paludibacterium sp. TaxID=1917523 RepID=UPI0025ED3A3A|nr:phospholipase D family protein [Paludibacterium sp.]MBV8048350.1 phospholipase D family protein [Paludibacterium sp.]MBV8469529.1 phospholipase D family protein [Burkholderiaceae bacterium]MBV8647092.1 phospholipase D family protein [Paludibacterium sp.]
MKRTLLLFVFLAQAAFASTPIPDARYDLGFSPGGTSLTMVQSGIASAKREILVAAYGFTSRPIAEALVTAARRGVRVAVIADRKSNLPAENGKFTALAYLAQQGIAVRLNGRYAIHHHKFMVIDAQTVETGSFNYSQAAVKSNAENVLLLWNVPALAKDYAREWQRLWDEGEPLRLAR